MSHSNLNGLPEKYFVAPEGKKLDEDAESALVILLEQIWTINDMINTDADGTILELDSGRLSILTAVISSLTHQAKLLHGY